MQMSFARRAAHTVLALTAAAILTTACGDDPAAPDDEPDTTRIVLTVGTGATAQTVTWTTANGSVSPATVTSPAGQSRVVTAQFLRADGSADPIVTAADFRLDLTPVTGTGVTVAKTGNLAATLTAGGTSGQSVTMTLALFHLGEGHNEYVSGPGALTVSVIAQ